jgi:membrane protein implicated in regulation of membrane protease activity
MLSTSLFWIIAGVSLCMVEFIFPTAFISFMMGVAALLVAVVSLVLPQFTILISLWLFFAIALTLLSRRFFTPKHKVAMTGDDLEAKAISGIPAGTMGRVLYEGNSWQAKCADETRDIAPNEVVYIVQKQGNTLIVLPATMIS